MALVDDRRRAAPSRPEPLYDRRPPEDQAAEQSALGGMLLSKDAIADVLEVISTSDFYKPAHALIFDAILDLYARGEPADAITVAAELERRGLLGRVGGAVYLHTLMSAVPTAANAGYYAQIVNEKAIMRRLVEAGTRIVQLGYGGGEADLGGGEIDEIVDRAQAEIYDVTERRTSEDYVVLEELLQPTMDEIDEIGRRGGRSMGVPTGFADLDDLTNGLHPGQMVIVAARPGIGKALALDTPLATPSGQTTMGNVKTGDYLVGADGQPTLVVATTDTMTGRPCFDVAFAGGDVIVADAEHQWMTWDSDRQTRAVRTTAELATDLAAGNNPRIAIPHPGHETHHVVAVTARESVPVRCVQVDNADHLYLAGRAGVPTHNSTLALDFARHAAVRHHHTAAIFSLEMSRNEITMRLLAAETGIRLSAMRSGKMAEHDWQKIISRMAEISDAPLYIDDSPNMTMMEIRAKARRLKQRHDLRLIVVDYLQLMTSGKRVESRQQEVSDFSRQMKLLAKELELPVVAISQLNRGPEQRSDKRPLLSDLRESGSLEQDADMVILLHRPDAWDAEDPRAGEADLIVAKHRNGPTTTIPVAHQLHYSRFADLAQ